MIEPHALLRILQARGVGFFAGVPDSLLKHFCACVASECEPARHVTAANEGGAIALGVGYHLATGGVPLIYLQNSGLGNAVNPLLSLADQEVYGIPLLLLVGWRGEPGHRDEPQHVKQGRVTPALLDAMEIPYSILDAKCPDLEHAVGAAVDSARSSSGPFALVVREGAFKRYRNPPLCRVDIGLRREEAIQAVLASLEHDDIVVATTGMASRELFECRRANGQPHDCDFLTVGGMGHASHIALGIAAHRPQRQVICLDGDGALLMHMGALAINAALMLPNFRHVCLNNGAHESVGGQASVAPNMDLPALAAACGYRHVERCESPAELATACQRLRGGNAPGFLEIRIDQGHRASLGRPSISPATARAALMEQLRAF